MISKGLISNVIEFGWGKLFDAVGALGSQYTQRQMFGISGFSSIPKDGDQCIIVRVGKSGDNIVCIATADKDTIDASSR